jgi:TRAP-type C4-dicarboxylate transport system substrate-binding protein
MSDKTWNALEPDDQKLIAGATADLSLKAFDVAQKNDEKYQEMLSKAGIKVVQLSDDQLKAWADHCRKTTWPKLEERLSKDLIDELKSQYQ